MREKITIAVDAMGGDNSPKKVIEGIKISLIKNPNLKFLLFGDKKILVNYLGN
jgi:glycerol-3-phosphate acyltransferase PlsX